MLRSSLNSKALLTQFINATRLIVQRLNQNFFQLFDLPESFYLDVDNLSAKYRDMQTEVHPDKFAAAPEQEKMHAVQMTSYINEAYSTLKSPIKRAAYILSLQGMDTESVNQNDLGMDLLMEQMQLRESLDELPKDESALPELDRLKKDVKERLSLKQNGFACEIEQGEYVCAKKIFHELQFLHKLLLEIEAGEEQRLDY